MECTWDAALLKRCHELDAELVRIIQQGSNEEYLAALTTAALDPRYTYTILAECENILPHICASLRSRGSFTAAFATLGRIIPWASYLVAFAVQLLEKEQYTLHTSTDSDEDLLYLLGLFRLLRFDHRLFQRYVRADELATALGRKSPPATYLILRILQIHLEAADYWFEEAVRRYLGPDTSDGDINGRWDEKIIDYRFLSLWEEDRCERMTKIMSAATQRQSPVSKPQRVLSRDLLHPTTALIGGVLLPQTMPRTGKSNLEYTFIETPTVSANLASLARSLKSHRPVLLNGLAGSGKSLLIRHVARSLGKFDDLITLHLNEQSDAKSLFGIYTTGDTPGSFIWKPGVLTTAVKEGRWVLIEDLDRAPNDILGTLLPLIEKRELFIPNRKETIYAAQSFRILATVRSFVNHRGEETKPLSHMLGIRHWQQISIAMASANEYADIAQELFPNLKQLLPQFMTVYERLMHVQPQKVLVGHNKAGTVRTISPRDLIKWCRRSWALMKDGTSFTSRENDAIYLEAVDCFTGALPDDDIKVSLAAVIAEELRVDPQRRDHLLVARDVHYDAGKSHISIGRYSLAKVRRTAAVQSSFSINPHTARMLERVAAAVFNREPLLLVGETGVGKTTAVQHLATNLGKKLIPFNLSQQSEAGDLLGGFKPVSTRTLIVPIMDEFDELFSESFSPIKNKQFLDLLRKQMAKSNWKPVCKLWRHALDMVAQQRAASPPPEGETPSKKRKVDKQNSIDFSRWEAFAVRVQNMERQLANGTDAFAFTFIEGSIVKAVRNGDWVLLDEINLASSETLESIVDLLDFDDPSILLAEAGNVERIKAHPEFRVFAAMNPATDVGKKDLSPGIRSRFTELYVDSPDKDIKSLQSIVRAYLRQEVASDAALASDVGALYQKIMSLATDNKLVDGAGQKPHFSLRTLTRTLTYAKHIKETCSIRRAVYEGFQMSFLTFLDAESAQIVQLLITSCLFGRANVKAELQKALRKPNDNRSYVQGFPSSKHWIRQGSLEPEDQPQYIITPFIASNLENLVRAASTRQFPVLIQGPTSSGKTSMIEYLAKRTGHKFTRINNHEHTDLQEYLGTYVSGVDGRLHFQEGILVNALREGHWLVLDELNLAPTDVLEALNRLLDDNRELLIPETQEFVRPHPEFMLFATQNPAGLYGGRKSLSRAFRNRFLELHFDDIPVNELQEILHRRTLLPESRCKRIVRVYRELSVFRQESRIFEQNSFATLRDLFRWALRQNDTIEELASNGFMLLCERVRKPEERIALKAVIEKVMSEKGPRVQIDEDALYAADSAEVLSYKQHANNQNVVWTKAMRRLYVLVSNAIKNNEPVLLVGETGCGKTTVCQMLAEALEKDLHTVNAHQNTETGDLIGSQRPVRNRNALEQSLRQLLTATPILQDLARADAQSTLDLLNAYDCAVDLLDKDRKASYVQTSWHAQVQASRTSFNALFEWADGSLVRAMRDGALFLLDEISLADDSVLERINSVLESQRTILLAEKGSLESFVTAAPGFQLFATMNPGGDYGKRELSPALRNRFTEIWVPALSDMNDVLQIVRGKLVDIAQPFAESMVSFCSWFKARFDNSASSSVSIRDTLAWVQFVNVFASLQVDAAIVHGAAMVYIDTLGANPAGLISTTFLSLDEERQVCLEELGRLLRIDAVEIYARSLEMTHDNAMFGIGPFTIPRIANSVGGDTAFTFEPPTTRSNAMRILRALQLSKPVMLEGSPGVGKTALVTAIADAAGMPLTRINLSDQTDLLDLFGSDTPLEGAPSGTFVWRDAPFLRALKTGEWVLLDEMNLASQSVLEGLNACLDHRGEVFVPELGQSFTRHPNFRVFAAQNPHHQGGGRKGLPASFVNRFTVVYADSFRPEDLLLICQRTSPGVEISYIVQVITFVSKLNYEVTDRRLFGSNGGPWEFNLRDITRWLTLASSNDGFLEAGTPRDFADMLFKQRFRSSYDRSYIDQLFGSIFDPATPLSDLYCNLSAQALQVGMALLRRDKLSIVGGHSREATASSAPQLKILQSTMLCVQQSWPVVLTGPSGSGKTKLIERLAECLGAEVVTLAMSADTDAFDLIGGYEQYDPHRRKTYAMKQLILRLLHFSKLDFLETFGTNVAKLLPALRDAQLNSDDSRNLWKLVHAMPDQIQSELLSLLEATQEVSPAIDKAKFEWIDGPLVEALRQGKWLVLDNANLCNASILDRLNSLLEPHGTLFVNEHSTEDGAPRIVRPHPSFRIFLTVDPRLGELSRAMRNRAVELYLVQGDDAVAATDGLQTESALARMRFPKTLDSTDQYAVGVALDHFSLSDKQLLPRLQRQLEAGLFSVGTATSVSRAKMSFNESLDAVVEGLYQQISSFMQVPADFACVQTFHPLNNQPLVKRSQQFLKFLSLGAQYDLNSASSALKRALSTLKPDRKLLERLSRLWKSLHLEANKAMKSGSREPLEYVERLLLIISRGFSQIEPASAANLADVRVFLGRLFSFCGTLLQSFRSDDFDLVMLAALISVGRNMLAAPSALVSTMFQALIFEFDQTLSELSLKSKTGTGQGYVVLWRALRPIMPSSMRDLNALLQLEDVVDRFDRATSIFQIPILQILELRKAFQRALRLSQSTSSDLDALVERASAIIPGSEQNLTPVVPHFAKSFELLCQHLASMSLGGVELQPSDIIELELFAGRKTTDSMSLFGDGNRRTPSQQLRLLGLSVPGSPQDDTRADTIPMGILQSLSAVHQVNLNNISLLEVESRALGHAMALYASLLDTSIILSLKVSLKDLLRTVLQSLTAHSVAPDSAAHAAQLLHSLDDREARIPLRQSGNMIIDESSNIIMPSLRFVVEYLQSSSLDHYEASNAWTAFATACLDLYVPEYAYDPVQESAIAKAIHQRTKGDMTARLSALLSVRKAWVGEPDSLRARLLQDDIQALGAAPETDDICRPPKSQLAQLQTEFRALMRTIQPLRQRLGQVDREDNALDASSWNNLHIIQKRLQEQYRPYADLTSPVTGFIDCLSVARHLKLKTAHVPTMGSSSGTSITPLVGARLQDWLSDEHFLKALQYQNFRSKDEQLYWLSVFAARTAVFPTRSLLPELRCAVENSFSSFYEAWRVELSRDQKAAAAKSSLYQYRGADDDSEEATQHQLDELFPSYFESAPSLVRRAGDRDAQALAPKMAELFHAIYRPDGSAPNNLSLLVEQWGQNTFTCAGNGSFAVVLVALNKLTTEFSSKNAARSLNIYLDSDIGQSKALVALVNRVRTRFRTIHSTWPEHATPIEVIRCCDQIVNLGYAEPIARFMPFVEKLHATISEWQKVTNSEFSADTLLDDITSLIVSWRQLELSTWAGMFDSENQACRRQAASWWYIAYESILRASEDSPQDPETLTRFSQSLNGTLGDFLLHCGLGEYSTRLSMLRDFEAALASRTGRRQAIVGTALANLVSFYSSFEAAVREQLSKRRGDLEKEIKNIIQVASWKDRNVETLKQSAKASHKKLFRTVRKYRQLLSEPVAPILQGDFPYVPGTSAAAPDKSLTAIGKISKFIQDLDQESAELREATPSTATEKDKTLVQHLKTRKRRLFADVLRDVRLMGFPTNISEAVLAQQYSLPLTLAQTSPLSLHDASDQHSEADQALHRLLHIIPKARETAVKHSEDLTPAEVARSKTLLEGMLHVTLEQRRATAQRLGHLHVLKTALSQFAELCDSEHVGVADSAEKGFESKVKSLRAMLQASAHIVEIQGRLGDKLYPQALDAIHSAIRELNEICGVLSRQANLPPGIDNSSTRSLRHRFTDALKATNTNLKESLDTHPELHPTLQSLIDWVTASEEGVDPLVTSESGAVSAHDWAHRLARVSGLVSTQSQKVPLTPVNGHSNRAWLLEQQEALLSALRTSHLDTISQDLETLMSQLHQVRLDEGMSLAQIVIVCQDVRGRLEAYSTVAEDMVNSMIALHTATSNMAYRLAIYFLQLTRQGFCQPPEKARDDQQQTGQVESGTGLGEGEGGEDISKDIGGDEDLSELAQDSTSKDEIEGTEAEKDAVDMADEDFEGVFEDDTGDDEYDEKEGKEGEEDAEIDEETGHVDDKDPGTVDEKTWDDGSKVEEAEKEADGGQGTKNEDVSAATEDAKSQAENDLGGEEEDSEAGIEADSELEHSQPEQADRYLDDEKNLELPDDLNIDGDKAEMSDISDDGSDFADDMDDDQVEEQEAEIEEADIEMGNDKDEPQHEESGEESGEAAAAEQEEEPGSKQDDQRSDIAMLDNQDDKFEHEDGLTNADGGHGTVDHNAGEDTGILSAAEQLDSDNVADQPNAQPGTAEGSNKTHEDSRSGQAEAGGEDEQSLAYKQLGDVLKEWYDQRRNIERAKETEDTQPDASGPMEMNDARFEHTDDAGADVQAVGAASTEQSKALDEQNAVPLEQTESDTTSKFDLDIEMSDPEDGDGDAQGDGNRGPDSASRTDKAVVGNSAEEPVSEEVVEQKEETSTDDLSDVDAQLTKTHLSHDQPNAVSMEEARQAWVGHEGRTRNMAVVLTEHLRLILQPTQATKMRGDFRSGKRLNIKKIIPYIASSYKRDKIWMRRSVPSKRAYQIMLAIDDSESMKESERKGLAFDTLALVAKSMSMLEVGELCIVGFGQSVNIAHDFSMPFTSDAGAAVIRQFSFSQSKTDVGKLLAQAIELFRAARLRVSGSASNLWQLQLIISDGLCEDHPSIRQLARQAREEQIMVIFIIVDATATGVPSVLPGTQLPRQSIVDLQRAEFTKDAKGEPQIKMVKYLDTFPFRHYLIVRDVLELPSVLAGALRQWFAEVVDSN